VQHLTHKDCSDPQWVTAILGSRKPGRPREAPQYLCLTRQTQTTLGDNVPSVDDKLVAVLHGPRLQGTKVSPGIFPIVVASLA
jgi:hypothetical protein